MFQKDIFHKDSGKKRNDQDEFDGSEIVQRITVMAATRDNMANLFKA